MLRDKIVAEIMTLVRQQPKRREKPTIEELERILNSETTDAVNIEADGSVSITPTVTTVGAVADKVVAVVDAEISWLVAEGEREKEVYRARWLSCLTQEEGQRLRGQVERLRAALLDLRRFFGEDMDGGEDGNGNVIVPEHFTAKIDAALGDGV